MSALWQESTLSVLRVVPVFTLVFMIGGCGKHALPAPRSTPSAASAAPSDSIREANDASVAAVLARIGDRRTLPADSVFRNLRLPHLRSVPASQFLGIMSEGYARALGVTCTHCHVRGNYASDDKRPKRAAREMALMHFGLNRQLAGMEHLATFPVDERYITCWTCHRGAVKPLDQ